MLSTLSEKLAMTAVEFPPMQKGASFNLDAVKAKIAAAQRRSPSRQIGCDNCRGIARLGTARPLSSIPTRFRLPTEDVDLLIQSGADGVLNHPTFRGL